MTFCKAALEEAFQAVLRRREKYFANYFDYRKPCCYKPWKTEVARVRSYVMHPKYLLDFEAYPEVVTITCTPIADFQAPVWLADERD